MPEAENGLLFLCTEVFVFDRFVTLLLASNVQSLLTITVQFLHSCFCWFLSYVRESVPSQRIIPAAAEQENQWNIVAFAAAQALADIGIGAWMFWILNVKCRPHAMPRSVICTLLKPIFDLKPPADLTLYSHSCYA